MSNKKHEARITVVQALYQWAHNPMPADRLIAEFMVEQDLSEISMSYFTGCVRGVLQELDAIDAAIKPLLDRPFEDLDPIELALLRLGAYELMCKVDVPFRVVLNEATELAKSFGATESHKYINAILDKLAATYRQAEKAR